MSTSALRRQIAIIAIIGVYDYCYDATCNRVGYIGEWIDTL